ncbi:MAG TPA: hypothetical protein DF383_02245 [Deltaproteobacteria bacterium]|nr:hypothetical protein [Deltaproteobacteria bacterium]
MKIQLFFILLIFLLSLPWGARGADKPKIQEVCPGHLTISAPQKIRFTKIEKTFLCGDPETEAWKRIPPAQVKFHLETFLQGRGYYHPRYREEGYQEGRAIFVELDEPVRASELRFFGTPAELDPTRRRRIVGRPLTPKLLDTVEVWTRDRLQAKGYPCPTVRARGNIVDGRIEVEIDSGPRQRLVRIEEDPVPHLQVGTLRRFDAFELGEYFNDDFLTLTSRRVEEDGILQNSYFIPECDSESRPESQLESRSESSPESKPGGAVAQQKNFAGKPRLFTFGIGVDTEEYVILKGSWSHHRIGTKGSKFSTDFYASYKRQELNLGFDWYVFAPGSRWHLLPNISFIHEREPNSHYISGEAQFAVARTWDTQNLGFQFSAGPVLSYTDTFSGAEPGLTRFLSLRYAFQMMSHYYEFYQKDPRSGFYLNLTGDFNNSNLLSELTAQRFQLRGQYLYNFLAYDPPLLILGVRGGLSGTFLPNNAEDLSKLPPNYRYFLGGSADLRGFDRNELPDGDGAFSAAFLDFEVRAGHVLPFNIQPLAFIDLGILGNRNMQFHAPLYYSPGFGIRYPSPIGVFRTTFAYGFKTSDDGDPGNTHFQFFFSYGEEF